MTTMGEGSRGEEEEESRQHTSWWSESRYCHLEDSWGGGRGWQRGKKKRTEEVTKETQRIMTMGMTAANERGQRRGRVLMRILPWEYYIIILWLASYWPPQLFCLLRSGFNFLVFTNTTPLSFQFLTGSLAGILNWYAIYQVSRPLYGLLEKGRVVCSSLRMES